MRPRLRLAVLSLSVAAVLGSQASAQEVTGFVTPSGNVACAAFENVLRCDMRENQVKAARPSSCDGDWGHAFSMDLTGRPSRLCAGDTIRGNYPVLAYGERWSHQGFSCRSETRGLTCLNARRKGWFINKAEQKFF
jgi:hypothetical protein